MSDENETKALIPGHVDRWLYWMEVWLQAKSNRSGSHKTEEEYRRVLLAFRRALHEAGLELDAEPRVIAAFAEQWAATPQRRFKAETTLRPSSIKHTLDILSSFYRYLVRHEVLARNPLELVERPRPSEYQGAAPLDFRLVRERLKMIPIQTLLGQRDLAILAVAFSTGRRASELVNLSIGDISPAGTSLRLTWKAKGGKRPFNILEPFAADALRSWLRRWYHAGWERKTDAPVWVRVEGDELQQGTRLSYWGIRDVYIRWFGEEASKVHSSRHTFAAMKLKSGASLLELMAALGHESLDVTYRYAKHLSQAIEADPQGAQIAAILGFDASSEDDQER